MNKNTVNILGVTIQNLSMLELLEKLNQSGGLVVTPNVDHLIKIQTDFELGQIYQSADYCVCDSKIIQYASYFLGQPIQEKISGSDLFPAFYEYNKNNQETKIFLLGAAEGIANQAQININNKVGWQMVVDVYSPPFGFEKDELECQKIIRKIQASGATVLALGLGTPKQEKWFNCYKSYLSNIKIFFAIGATIDFEAGHKTRSPKWISEIGMEWLYRLLLEPKRLAKRYLIDDLPFFILVLKQKFFSSSFNNSQTVSADNKIGENTK